MEDLTRGRCKGCGSEDVFWSLRFKLWLCGVCWCKRWAAEALAAEMDLVQGAAAGVARDEEVAVRRDGGMQSAKSKVPSDDDGDDGDFRYRRRSDEGD
jgi:hypothetical protein